jgi:DNA-binding transcriptional MerR regulator
MAAVNKIVKYNLEEKARILNERGTSLRDIADILSHESKQDINKNSVYNFLKSDTKYTAEIIEKKTALKVAVAEAEISTIEDRKKVIRGLLAIAESSEFDRDRVAAYKVATEALDSLDKRLGKLSGVSGVTINNINAVKLADIPTEQLLRMANVTGK